MQNIEQSDGVRSILELLKWVFGLDLDIMSWGAGQYARELQEKLLLYECHWQILEHLNSIKPGAIVFTETDQIEDALPVFDLKQRVDRKAKQVECMVHYKKTHTNINECEGKIKPSSLYEEKNHQGICGRGAGLM